LLAVKGSANQQARYHHGVMAGRAGSGRAVQRNSVMTNSSGSPPKQISSHAENPYIWDDYLYIEINLVTGL
jgi:hypothetical protein